MNNNCFPGCKDPNCKAKLNNNKFSDDKREALEIVLEMLFDHKTGKSSLIYEDLIKFGREVCKFTDGNFANKTGAMPSSHCLNLNCSKDASCSCQCATCLGIDKFSFKRTGFIRRVKSDRRYYDRRGSLESALNENQEEAMPSSAKPSFDPEK